MAFTLVELLVSMAVLVIIVVFTAQMVSSATRLTSSSTKRLDTDEQARLVFQRMSDDLARMVRRQDADCIFSKVSSNGTTGGDDRMFFYSEAPAYFDGTTAQAAVKSPLALVGYRINNGCQLERLSKTLTWDGAPSAAGGAPGGIMFLTSNATKNPLAASTLSGNWPDTIGTATDSPPYSSGTNDTDYNVLAEQVFRLEVCYLLQPAPHTVNGTLQNVARYSALPITAPEGVTNYLTATQPPKVTDDSSAGYQAGSRWYDAANSRAYVCTNSGAGNAVWKILGSQDVAAVMVTIAVLDSTSSKIIPTFNARISYSQAQTMPFPDVRKLNAALADIATDAPAGGNMVPDLSGTPPRFPAEAWQNTLNQSGFAQQVGIPQAALGQVRIYQRCLYLNPLH